MPVLPTICLLATAFAGLGIASTTDAQTVYRTTDNKGNVAFTDRPPLQQSAEAPPLDVTTVEVRMTNVATVAALRTDAVEQASAEKEAKNIRKQQEAEDADLQVKKEAQRKENCKIATQRLSKYSQARRIYRDLGNGEREYLDEASLDAERANAVRAVDEWCGS